MSISNDPTGALIPVRASGVAALRTLASVAALTTLYFVVPLDGSSTVRTVLLLLGSLVVYGLLAVWQVRAVRAAEHPGWRAVEGLALVLPLFTFLFATAYVLIEQESPGSFGAPLTRIDALYFTMTVLATVGFGDIVAKSQLARAVVTVQMVADLVVLGAVLRAMVAAVRHRRGGGEP